MDKEIKRMTVASLIKVKDRIDITGSDLIFLNGMPLKEKVNPDNENKEISNITFSIMLRVLLKEEAAMPFEIVNHEEALQIIKKYEPNIKEGQYSVYFGLSYWSAQNWNRGDAEPALRVKRSFLMIKKLTDLFGQEGWNIWKEALEEEAISRGTTFNAVIKTGTWSPKEAKNNDAGE